MSYTTHSSATSVHQSELAAKRAARADAAWLRKLLQSTPAGQPCYTSMSDGYSRPDAEFPLLDSIADMAEFEDDLSDAPVTEVDEQEFPHRDILAVSYGKPWMEATAEDLGLSWTSPLRRSTIIDPMDSTEALDATADYIGVHMVIL